MWKTSDWFQWFWVCFYLSFLTEEIITDETDIVPPKPHHDVYIDFLFSLILSPLFTSQGCHHYYVQKLLKLDIRLIILVYICIVSRLFFFFNDATSCYTEQGCFTDYLLWIHQGVEPSYRSIYMQNISSLCLWFRTSLATSARKWRRPQHWSSRLHPI